jgi:hypothetical protein
MYKIMPNAKDGLYRYLADRDHTILLQVGSKQVNNDLVEVLLPIAHALIGFSSFG